VAAPARVPPMQTCSSTSSRPSRSAAIVAPSRSLASTCRGAACEGSLLCACIRPGLEPARLAARGLIKASCPPAPQPTRSIMRAMLACSEALE
jgi:hypothetical protein